MPVFVEDPLNGQHKDWNIYKYYEDREIFVERPPYQRKTVWDTAKKRELMDSFVRQLYVPPVVLRQVVLNDSDLRFEVVDGQQRITSIQEFFGDEFGLPDTQELRELVSGFEFAGKRYSELDEDVQAYLKSRCSLRSMVLRDIQDPTNREHQELATRVFWRLQQGEHLTNIEKNHSKIYSPVRNFIVEVADDISFDRDSYASREENPNRHEFFELVAQPNNRLKNLGLLARFLLIEFADGPRKVTGKEVTKLFDCRQADLILKEDVDSFRDRKAVKRVEEMLDLLADLYRDDPLKTNDGEVEFLRKEYFMISLYTLIRVLKFGNYRFNQSHYDEIREFTHDWFKRFEMEKAKDTAMLQFKDARQQNRQAVNKRHLIIENEFWSRDPDIQELDPQRGFSRAQRIQLFMDSDRVCSMCVEDGKTEEQARISWSNFDADHVVPHADGGSTTLENGRVLCPTHNRSRPLNGN